MKKGPFKSMLELKMYMSRRQKVKDKKWKEPETTAEDLDDGKNKKLEVYTNDILSPTKVGSFQRR